MARARVSIATMPFAAPLWIAAALWIAACTTIVYRVEPTSSPGPSSTPIPVASSPAASPGLPPATPTAPPLTCSEPFVFPAFDAFVPVPGVSVRAIDRAHVEITNATTHTYYVGASFWVTEDNLVCGRGVIEQATSWGRLRPGRTIERGGGSSSEIPLTISIWEVPCSDGCTRDPIGQYLVPVSSVEPPVPGST